MERLPNIRLGFSAALILDGSARPQKTGRICGCAGDTTTRPALVTGNLLALLTIILILI